MIDIKVPVERFEEFRKLVVAVAKKFKVTGKITKLSESSIAKVYDPQLEKEVDHPVYDCTVVIDDAEYAKFTGSGDIFLGSIFKEDVVTVGASPDGRKAGIRISDLKDEIANMTCCSCEKKIGTRKKLLVFEDSSGAVKTYGTTCAKTKYGINFESLITRFTRIKDMIIGGSNWERDYTNANEWMVIALDHIQKYGYTSNSKAYNNQEVSTTSQVWSDYHAFKYSTHMRSPWEAERREYITELIENNPFPMDVLNSIEFFKEDDDSDFAFNMKAAITLVKDFNGVSSRTGGFIAYAVFRVYKEMKEQKEATEDKLVWNLEHSYNEGDKIKKIDLTCVSIHNYYSNYDGEPRSIYTMKDENNVRMKWFSDAERIKEGESVHITSCTVKALEDHPKFGQAVVLTRCRVKK